MKKIVIKARAKINLSLLIKGTMQDGFHELDTVMCPIDLYDIVTLERRSDCDVTCNGLNISTEDNSAFKAARILVKEFNTQGIDITIEKNIPYSGGLGGSSADAAAIMYGFSRLFHIEEDKVKFLARQVGSDIPFMLQVNTGAMRARGIGDILTAEEIEPLDIVIAKPENGVDTRTAYKIYDEMGKKGGKGDIMAMISAIRKKEELCKYLINDLYAPAIKLNPEIEPLYKLMKKHNDNCAVMSGSGSSVIGICHSAEEAEKLYDKIPESYLRLITKTCKECLEIVE